MLRKNPMRAMLLRTCGLLAIALLGRVCLAADFLGAESCQSCHPEAYTAWRASPHARARDVLSAQQQKNARCLSCHSPNEDQKSAAVSCETCHGGGQYYSARFVMKDPDLSRLVGLTDPSEKGCRACHDASSPSLKAFDFTGKLKAIDHWSAERTRRADRAGAEKSAP